MKTVLALLFVLALALASVEDRSGEAKSDDPRASKQVTSDREETTEKTNSAPQVYQYRPGQGTVYPNNLYPSSYNPNSGYPSSYNPSGVYPSSYNPSGVYPSSYNPNSLYPSSYNPSNPGSYYPTVYGGSGGRGVGGVYPGGSIGGLGEGFTARRASPRTTQGSRVILTEPVTQSGSGWNVGRSEYVAPSAGLYFFTFAAVSDRNTHFRMTLRHNGIEVVSAYGDAAGYQMAGQSCVLRLASGDRVYLQLDEGRLYDVTSARAYTAFSGFRIL